jgi:4-amino-4-deoxy-L-arabinose transferase-like glycosyltransferase
VSAKPHPDGLRTPVLCVGTGLLVFLVQLAGLGAFHLLDVDEPRFATASRTMLELGDWVVPYFNGEVRYDKPILIYWFQASCMALFGATEFAARLPSAFGIALGAAATTGMARTLGLGGLVSMLAGAIVGTCIVAQMIGHGATADGMLLGLTAATCWLLLHRAKDGKALPRAGYGTALGVLLAACFLDKGPPALVSPLALGIALAVTRRGTTWFEGFVAAFVATGLTLTWAVPALVRTEGGFWSEGVGHHVIERSTSGFEGHGGFEPWWYLFYLLAIPAAFLPWAAFGARTWAAFRDPVPHGLSLPDRRALGIWFALVFVVFTAATSKLAHYPLPGFPVLGILTAAGIGVCANERSPQRVGAAVAGFLALALGLGLPIAFPALGLALPLPAVFGGAIALVGLGTTAVRLARGAVVPAAVACLLSMAAFWPYAALFVLPEFTRQSVAARITDLAGDVPADRELVLYQLTMPTASFYLHRSAPRTRGTGELVETRTGEPHERTAERVALETIERGGVVITRDSRIDWLLTEIETIPEDDRRARLKALVENPARRIPAFLASKGKVIDLIRLELPGRDGGAIAPGEGGRQTGG